MKNASVTLTASGISYHVPVPDSLIPYSPSATSASTRFNTSSQQWETVVPERYDKNVFLGGAAFPVPAGFGKVTEPVVWTATFSSDASNITIDRKWAAAVYTNFSLDYDTIGVKSVDDKVDAVYKNADHAGTPEDKKEYVIGGARGGGGSNFTGSYSGTQKVKLECKCVPPPVEEPELPLL